MRRRPQPQPLAWDTQSHRHDRVHGKRITCGDCPGWYDADAEMRDIRGVIYISKRAAIASIRALTCGKATGSRFRAPLQGCRGRSR